MGSLLLLFRRCSKEPFVEPSTFVSVDHTIPVSRSQRELFVLLRQRSAEVNQPSPFSCSAKHTKSKNVWTDNEHTSLQESTTPYLPLAWLLNEPAFLTQRQRAATPSSGEEENAISFCMVVIETPSFALVLEPCTGCSTTTTGRRLRPARIADHCRQIEELAKFHFFSSSSFQRPERSNGNIAGAECWRYSVKYSFKFPISFSLNTGSMKARKKPRLN